MARAPKLPKYHQYQPKDQKAWEEHCLNMKKEADMLGNIEAIGTILKFLLFVLALPIVLGLAFFGINLCGIFKAGLSKDA